MKTGIIQIGMMLMAGLLMTVTGCKTASEEMEEENKEKQEEQQQGEFVEGKVFVEPFMKKDASTEEIIEWMGKDTQMGGWNLTSREYSSENVGGATNMVYGSKNNPQHDIYYVGIITEKGTVRYNTRNVVYPYGGEDTEKWLVSEIEKRYGCTVIDESGYENGGVKVHLIYFGESAAEKDLLGIYVTTSTSVYATSTMVIYGFR